MSSFLYRHKQQKITKNTCLLAAAFFLCAIILIYPLHYLLKHLPPPPDANALTCLPSNTGWVKTFGRLGEDFPYDIHQTNDKGYIMIGYTPGEGDATDPTWLYPISAGNPNIIVLKLDECGNLLWQKTLGGSAVERGYHIEQISDGGYILSGSTNSFGAGNVDIALIRLNSVGNVVWQKTLGGLGLDYGDNITQTSDGGFIFFGTSASWTGYYGIIEVKLDSNGNVVWSKSIFSGVVNGDWEQYTVPTSDGGYILTGYTTPSGSSYNDVLVIKLDSSGNILWQKTYASTEGGTDDFGTSIGQTSDGGYIVTGHSRTFVYYPSGSWNIFFLRLDSSGNILWQKTYGGTSNGGERADDIEQTSDGGFFFSGRTSSYGQSNYYSALFLKLDTNGNLVWQKIFGASIRDWATKGHQTADGGYISTGVTSSFGTGAGNVLLWDSFILKMTSAGDINTCSPAFQSIDYSLTAGTFQTAVSSLAVNNFTVSTVDATMDGVPELTLTAMDICGISSLVPGSTPQSTIIDVLRPPPLAPKIDKVMSSNTSIRWYFNDANANESGFALHDQNHKVLVTTAPIWTTDINYLDETKLQEDTLYCGRHVHAFNATGESTSSPDFPCVKTLDFTKPIISEIKISASTTDGAEISWETSKDTNQLAHYWRNEKNIFITATSTPFTKKHTLSLSGLATSTLYSFFVSSADPSGNEASSTILTFKTLDLPDLLPPKILNLNITVKAKSAEISWQTNKSSNTKILSGESISSLNTKAQISALSVDHTIKLKNLKPKTIYYFKIFSKDSWGNETSSQILNLKTFSAAPPKILNLKLKNIKTTEAFVTWKTDKPVTGIIFIMTTKGKLIRMNDNQLVLDHSLTLNNLLPNTDYYVVVYAVDAENNVMTQKTIKFKTKK